MRNNLQDVKEYLLLKQQGAFEPDDYLGAWYEPTLCAYFLERAVEIVPKTIRFGIGLPYQCHMNSLTYAGEHPGSVAFFGFQWRRHLGEDCWDLHSFVVDQDGTLIDSGEHVLDEVRYFGVPWSVELHDVITKKEIAAA